jgi:hypothetical protein
MEGWMRQKEQMTGKKKGVELKLRSKRKRDLLSRNPASGSEFERVPWAFRPLPFEAVLQRFCMASQEKT